MKQILLLAASTLLALAQHMQAQAPSYSLTYGGYWDFDRPGFKMVAHPQTGNLLVVNCRLSNDTYGSMFEFDRDSVKLVDHYFKDNTGDTSFYDLSFALDRQGNYYSADNKKVLKFGSSRKYMGIFVSREHLAEVDAYADNLELGADGLIYYNTPLDTIYGHDPATGAQVVKLGIGKGDAADKFHNIEDMYFDKAKPYFYTVDGVKARLCRHDMQGRFLKCVGKRGSAPGDFVDFPRQVAVGSDGKVFVVDDNTNVNVYDSTLSYLYQLPKYTHTCCQLSINDIVPGANGIVYLLDRNIGLIKYTPEAVSAIGDGRQPSELRVYPSPAAAGRFVVDSPEPVSQVLLMSSTGQQEQHGGAQVQTQLSGLLLMKVRLASGRELIGKIVVE